MTNGNQELAAVLERVSSALSDLTDYVRNSSNQTDSDSEPAGEEDDEAGTVSPSCVLNYLPPRLAIKAAKIAMQLNPVNGVSVGRMDGMLAGVMNPMAIAVLVQKYWGPRPRRLTVSFMDNPPAVFAGE